MELLERILDSRNVRRAYEQVMANKGHGGIGGIEIEGFKSHVEATWPAVKTAVQESQYQPSAVRKVEIRKLDKELENRGHRFVRYADDVCLFVKSSRAAERVLESVSYYIEKELKLEVNRSKSAATRPWRSKLLGYSFYHKKGEKGLTIAKSSIAKYKSKMRMITSRSRPYAMYKRYEMLRQLNRGWVQYFKLNEAKGLFRELDKWVQHRIRQCYWKQWKLPSTRVKMLVNLGTPEWQAYQWGNTRKGYWRISQSPILIRVLNKSFDNLFKDHE